MITVPAFSIVKNEGKEMMTWQSLNHTSIEAMRLKSQ